MNQIRQWLANHSITAKTVVTGWLFLDGMYYGMPEFHSYVMNAYSHLPKGIHAFVAGVVVPGLIFWRTQRRTKVPQLPVNTPAGKDEA